MTAVGAVVSAIVALLWLLLLITGLRGAKRTPVVGPVEGEVSGVAAFMPARNEAEVIKQAVDGLRTQAPLVVIDDQSTDGTREVLAGIAGIQIVEGTGPGEGECGKPAALLRGYEHVADDARWLLFVDADVILEPGAVAGLVAHAQEVGADAVTVLPRLTLTTPIEKIVMPSIGALIVAQYPPAAVADPSSPVAFLNGQVILVRRELYEHIGGHRAVIADVLEDVALGRHLKQAGGKLSVVDGRKIARTRMYDGWRELREGWTKNLYLLMGSSASRTVVWALLSVVLGGSGWLAFGVAGWPFGVATLLWAVTVQVTLRRTGSVSPWWAIFAPLGAAVTAFLLLESLWRHRGGRSVAWKGRTYGSTR
ncbi:MAG: glycosyltransferase [Deltaproteobacteria bacterium]